MLIKSHHSRGPSCGNDNHSSTEDWRRHFRGIQPQPYPMSSEELILSVYSLTIYGPNKSPKVLVDVYVGRLYGLKGQLYAI